MTHRFRNVIAVVAAAACLSAAAGAQQPQQGQAHDQDAHHRDMLTRGAQAMGFDQERTVHHFLLYEDGGAIDVAVKEASDHANLHAVRQHLQQIAGLFKAGDFGKPALTHAQEVPGTADMTRLKDGITYQYEETPAGGRVRIVTRDAAALAAVHAFLHLQIEDHRTGDSGVVERSASGRMMDGMGSGMMRGSHDAATMAEMSDIHELFVNHDRITRTVTNLPNGIRTVTESADPRIAQLLKDHVTSMGQRVESGNDPGLPIESQALGSIYRNHDKIHTTLEPTATGIVVVQTSTDQETVAALQQHASEVTDFVKAGMAAMHMAMMKNGGMIQHGMRGRMMETAPQSETTPSTR
ncbi:MAG TPA: hypothetical protein VM818_06270 [Vicinamibacterales bacterium]|jgi:hypothetical protein|nr:hypothetical protein [Vicinamibacterales bacterium]